MSNEVEETVGDSEEPRPDIDAQSTESFEPVGDEEGVWEDGAPPAKRRLGLYLTPRQAFLVMASVLGVLLVALVVYLLWLASPADYTEEGGSVQGGLAPVLAIYGPGRQPEPGLRGPMGAAWSRDGKRLYVADTQNNRICVFSDKGRAITEFGQLGVAKPLAGAQRTWDPGEFSYPVDVAVDDEGRVYVADFYNDSISVLDANGKFIRRFPDPYSPTGKGSSGHDGGGIAITAIAVAGNKVYATDEYQVFVFDTAGKLLLQFGRPGMGAEGLDHPGGIAVDRDGNIYVSDSNHNRVMAFDAKGSPLWVTGRPVSGLQEKSDNPFVLPRGLTVLRDGSLLVADPLGQQLVQLDTNGQVIRFYGVRGTGEGQINFPNDVSVSEERILVADRQNHRVQVVKLIDR